MGTPSELYENPATRFVASFIGETNLFHGTVSEIEQDFCVIKGRGSRFRARHRNDIAHGQAVFVAIRPERTVLSRGPSEQFGDAENVVIGQVSELIYLGRSRKYLLRTADTQFSVTQQITGSNCTSINVGDSAAVSWKAEDCVAIPAT